MTENDDDFFFETESLVKINNPAIQKEKKEVTKEQIQEQEEQRAIERRKRERILTAQKRLNDALDFIKCAEIDLLAAEVLNEKGIYSASIYHLQQTVEKAVKADYLCLTYWKPETLKIEGHNSTRKILISMKAAKEVSESFGIDISDPEYETMEYAEFVDSQKRLISASLSEDDLIKLFKDSDERILYQVIQADNIFYKKYQKVQSSSDLKSLWEDLILGKESCELADTILLVSMLTDDHISTTRYPNIGRDKKINPWDYTLDRGLVKATHMLIDRMARSLVLLRKQQAYLISHPNLN